MRVPKKLRVRRGPVSEVGGQLLIETSTDVQRAFGPEFETVVAIFVRKKDEPGQVTYFGAMEIPELANLIGEMSRDFGLKKMLGQTGE